jgi:hypothetical protein
MIQLLYLSTTNALATLTLCESLLSGITTYIPESLAIWFWSFDFGRSADLMEAREGRVCSSTVGF